MSTRPSLSLAAAAAGLPPRYVYWHGHSGRRYLFTAADGAGLADFDEGVAIAVQAGRIVWAGEVGALGGSSAAAIPPGASILVHLLAATAGQRAAISSDLRPEGSGQLRRAA